MRQARVSGLNPHVLPSRPMSSRTTNKTTRAKTVYSSCVLNYIVHNVARDESRSAEDGSRGAGDGSRAYSRRCYQRWDPLETGLETGLV